MSAAVGANGLRAFFTHIIFYDYQKARGKRCSRGLLHSSTPQSDSQPLENNRQSDSVGRFLPSYLVVPLL